MKLPKTKKRYCPYCKKHTEHKTSQAKRKTHGSKHTQTRGSKKRARKRGRLGTGNKGRFSRKAIGKFKATGKKLTKKTDLRFTCKQCKKSHIQKKGKRAKKIEIS
tara:strand:+ start:60 stop:374 length:315 start_codon:yes stop_codon:yes gene_type:complete